MAQSKVVAIHPKGSFESQHGTMYTFKVSFEDGESLEANAKSQTPPYVVGDLVEYQITGHHEKYGNKGKVKKFDPEQAQGGGFNAPKMQPIGRTPKDVDIMRQTALKAAVEFNANRQVEVSRVLAEAEMMHKWLLGELDLLDLEGKKAGKKSAKPTEQAPPPSDEDAPLPF